jgi:hypothetical protein
VAEPRAPRLGEDLAEACAALGGMYGVTEGWRPGMEVQVCSLPGGDVIRRWALSRSRARYSVTMHVPLPAEPPPGAPAERPMTMTVIGDTIPGIPEVSTQRWRDPTEPPVVSLALAEATLKVEPLAEPVLGETAPEEGGGQGGGA